MKQQDLSVGKPYIDYTNDQLLHPGFLKGIYGNENIERFIREKVHGEKYNPTVEKNLLILLGSNADNIEDHILTIKDKQRYELSLLDIYALEYYTKKIIAATGINRNVNIDMFKHSKGVNNGAAGTRGSYINIHNNEDDQRVSNILKTIHHESAHCIVFNMMESGTLEDQYQLDEDIGNYCKDKVLLTILYNHNEGEEYEKENYNNFSYEFDADFRSLLMQNKLYKKQDEFNLRVEEVYSKFPERDVEKIYMNNFMFFDSNVRRYDGEDYTLDELFENIMNAVPYSEARAIYEQYPTIRYEYNFNSNGNEDAPNIERKSADEFIKQYMEAKKSNNELMMKINLKYLAVSYKDYGREEFKAAMSKIAEVDSELAVEIEKTIMLSGIPITKYKQENGTSR